MKFVQNQFPQNASCHVELIFYHKHVLQCSFYHMLMLMRVTIQSQLVKPTWVYCFVVEMCNSLKAKLSLQLSLLNEQWNILLLKLLHEINNWSCLKYVPSFLSRGGPSVFLFFSTISICANFGLLRDPKKSIHTTNVTVSFMHQRMCHHDHFGPKSFKQKHKHAKKIKILLIKKIKCSHRMKQVI